MLSFTKKTDYALVALAFLARRRVQSEGAVSARQMAEHLHLPDALLSNILKDLAQARILDSTRGSHGGYALATDASRVTLTEVLIALEGPIELTQCCDDNLPIVGQADERCPTACTCSIREPVKRLHQRLTEFFDHVTIADLIENRVDVALDRGGFPLKSAAPATAPRRSVVLNESPLPKQINIPAKSASEAVSASAAKEGA